MVLATASAVTGVPSANFADVRISMSNCLLSEPTYFHEVASPGLVDPSGLTQINGS